MKTNYIGIQKNLHVSVLDAHHGTSESLELSSRQVLHITITHIHQI